MSDLRNSFTQRSLKDNTTIQDSLIRSPTLSAKGFKLLCIGLSHSGNWDFNKERIGAYFKEGSHTVDEAMKEIRTLGYLHLKAKSIEHNKFNGHMWFWFDVPVSEEEFKLFFRKGDFQGDRNFGRSGNHPGINDTSLRSKEVPNDSDRFDDFEKKINDINDINDSSMASIKKEKKPKSSNIKYSKYFNSLDSDQKDLFKEITSLGGVNVIPACPDAVTFWLLELDIGGTDRVREVLEYFYQENPKSQVDNIGGWMKWALENGKTPEGENEKRNREFSKEISKVHSFIEVTQKYVKVISDYFGTEQFNFSLPEESFKKQVKNQIEKVKINQNDDKRQKKDGNLFVNASERTLNGREEQKEVNVDDLSRKVRKRKERALKLKERFPEANFNVNISIANSSPATDSVSQALFRNTEINIPATPFVSDCMDALLDRIEKFYTKKENKDD
jgi:hypothetical protein